MAQGGDWGALVAVSLGNQAPKGLKSVHFNSIYFDVKVGKETAPGIDGNADVFAERGASALGK